MATFISGTSCNDPKYTTTSTNVGYSISSNINMTPTYSINLNGTVLTTDDIEFVHALQKHGGSAQDISIGLQNFMQKAKAD